MRWKAECERSCVDASLADPDEREFLIGFLLHSRITGERGVEVRLEEPRWLTHAEQGPTFSTGYYPNESGQLAEIICRMQASDPAEALRRCHAHVARTLDYWSAAKGRGFAILGFRIADLKHNAKWRSLPHRPSHENFEAPLQTALLEYYHHVMALYREARNSSSDIYRLLCCCKILRIWTNRAEPFDQGGAQFDDLEVTPEMLVLSGMIEFRPDLEGTSFSKLLDRIGPWRDRAAASVVSDQFPVDLDDYEQGLELAAVANLIDLAVHRILSAAIANLHGSAATREHESSDA